MRELTGGGLNGSVNLDTDMTLVREWLEKVDVTHECV